MRFGLLAALVPVLALGAGGRLVEGNPESPVRVLIFEDLQCPDCAAFRNLMDEKLLPKYGGTVAFEHRDFPLAKHAWARQAAVAARFFQEKSPELALKYRRETMRSIKQTTPENFKDRLAAFAKAGGVDPAGALAALDDQRLDALVEKDFQDGVARGVSHTPTAFVNGVPFVETITLEEISKALDAALQGAAK
ncbi:MAG: thioredoxin domain-containing protein [Acidobacteriota bacterium]